MGISKTIWEYEKGILDLLGLKYEGLKWCELGNQRTDEGKVAKKTYTYLAE